MMKIPLCRNGVRILRPQEYKLLSSNLKPHHRIFFNTLLLTGMRYVEAQRFQDHPEWFDGEFIHLPKMAILKQKRKQMERSVRLNSLGKQIIPFFLELDKKLPTPQTWGENLKRWAKQVGLDPTHLCAKSTRKTIESWLVSTYKDRVMEIALSQGHTTVTAMRHYLNLAFTHEDILQMKEYVQGWI